ncbi:MAG: hypothetical protein H6658_10735 [Ardenticatenaceae bacterium]|nr:hypothetical protein [Ardenticatenaceae bacterium]
MATPQLIIHTLTFSLTLWLGFYLIARDMRNARLWLAGLALTTYAVGVAMGIMGQYGFTIWLAVQLLRWQNLFTVLPAAFWLGLLLHLFLAETTLPTLLSRYPRTMALVLGPTVLYALSLSFIILPMSPPDWVGWFMTASVLVMGTAVTHLHTCENGEAFWPPLLRSFDYTFFTALLFGGQIILVMALSTGVTFPMLLLLLTTITAAILIQAFAGAMQTFVDSIAFFNFPQIKATRAELRAAADATTHVNHSLNLEQMQRDEFTRLTRRALSHMGNLPKLAHSPLNQLPLVEKRLADQNTPPSTLTRAAELKVILTESIERLRPPNGEAIGTTDEWRHYNALYVPYVLGLKPHRRQFNREEVVDTAVQPILNWFRTQVPERTLYNWQNKAAELVAQDLRERSRRVGQNGR